MPRVLYQTSPPALKSISSKVSEAFYFLMYLLWLLLLLLLAVSNSSVGNWGVKKCPKRGGKAKMKKGVAGVRCVNATWFIGLCRL